MKNIYKILVVAVMLGVLYFGQETKANNTFADCNYTGGTVCTQTTDDLAQGSSGMNPGTSVNLSFAVFKKADASVPDCRSNTKLYHAIRTYSGSSSDYIYQKAGLGGTIDFSFNSGTTQAQFRFAGVFFCWPDSFVPVSAGDKGLIDALAGTGQYWTTPLFNQTTRAGTIDVDCSKVTQCPNYITENDCRTDRCGLKNCNWQTNLCFTRTNPNPTPTTPPAGSADKLVNPIGISNFQDLINLIGVWIFNLAIPIAVIIIIYAGVLILTAAGNTGRFKQGTEALKYAVIGLAIVLIGKGFVTLIQSILSLRNP